MHRPKMVEVLKEKFADLGLTYSIGGQISFDVFPQVSMHIQHLCPAGLGWVVEEQPRQQLRFPRQAQSKHVGCALAVMGRASSCRVLLTIAEAAATAAPL